MAVAVVAAAAVVVLSVGEVGVEQGWGYWVSWWTFDEKL